MNVDGVSAVFYGSDYITVTKSSDTNWGHVKPEVFSLITEAITAGKPLVNVAQGQPVEGQGFEEKDSLAYDENDDEVVAMIKELLETRIRPAIQEDGEFSGTPLATASCMASDRTTQVEISTLEVSRTAGCI